MSVARPPGCQSTRADRGNMEVTGEVASCAAISTAATATARFTGLRRAGAAFPVRTRIRHACARRSARSCRADIADRARRADRRRPDRSRDVVDANHHVRIPEVDRRRAQTCHEVGCADPWFAISDRDAVRRTRNDARVDRPASVSTSPRGSRRVRRDSARHNASRCRTFPLRCRRH